MEKKVILIIVFLCPLLLGWHWFEPAARKNLKGIESYQNKEYETALNEFLSAKGIKPDLPELKNNTASALYQMKKYKEALEEFSGIDPEKVKIPASRLFYNVGNSFFRLEQYDKALESYKKSLLADPSDMDAKKNFEITLKKIEDQKKQQDQKDQDKKDQEDKKDQKDQNKDKQDQKNQDQKDQDKKDQQQKQPQQKPEEKHKNLMQYLNQNEKKQLEKKKRAVGVAKKEKDW